MNMDNGCIFSEKGKCVVRADTSTYPGDICSICCYGSDVDKSRCPERGQTIAAENYYKAKLDAETRGEMK